MCFSYKEVISEGNGHWNLKMMSAIERGILYEKPTT